MEKYSARNAGQGIMRTQDRQGFSINHWGCVPNAEKTGYSGMKKHVRNAGQKIQEIITGQKNREKGIMHQTASGTGKIQNRGFASSVAGVRLWRERKCAAYAHQGQQTD